MHCWYTPPTLPQSRVRRCPLKLGAVLANKTDLTYPDLSLFTVAVAPRNRLANQWEFGFDICCGGLPEPSASGGDGLIREGHLTVMRLRWSDAVWGQPRHWE